MRLLLNTWDEFKDHFPLTHTTLDLERLWPFIQTVQETYLEEVMGEEMLEELLAYYEGDGSGSGSGSGGMDAEKWDGLVSAAQRVLALLAIHEGLPFLEVRIGNEGIHQMAADSSAQPIFSTQREDIRENALRQGLNALERMVRYLEKHEAEFETWADSDHRAWQRAHIIRDAKEFTEHWSPMADSRVTFRAMRSKLVDVEEKIVLPILGPALYDALLEEQKVNNVSAANKDLLRYLKPMVAKWAAADAMPMLRLAVGAYGVYTVQIEKTQKDVMQKLTAKEHEAMREAERLLADAQWRRQQLLAFMDANAEEYPLWKDGETDTREADAARKEAWAEERKDHGIQGFF